jgi:hypothetical protein
MDSDYSWQNASAPWCGDSGAFVGFSGGTGLHDFICAGFGVRTAKS